MDFVALGGTDMLVSHTAFGAMSLGEVASDEEASQLVHKAYEGGVNFFDTAHDTVLSEQRLGNALKGMRSDVFLSTKSTSKGAEALIDDLKESLEALKTDYVDVFQLENPEKDVVSSADSALYKSLLSAKNQGLTRHIGIVTESLEIADIAVNSGLFETVQLSFNVLSSDEARRIVKQCEEKEIGVIAMQPLNGGIISNIPIAFGFLNQFDSVVPVWGVRNSEELQQILYFTEHPPVIDDDFKAEAEKLRMLFS